MNTLTFLVVLALIGIIFLVFLNLQDKNRL